MKRSSIERRLRLMVEARDEIEAARHEASAKRHIGQKEAWKLSSSMRYAQTALGLLSGAEHEASDLARARMVLGAEQCLRAARRLLWGAETVRARDVN